MRAPVRARSPRPSSSPRPRCPHDQYMQAMPEYGPERMGAPIKAFTRISDEPIEIHNNIENPDVVVVLDETPARRRRRHRGHRRRRHRSSSTRARRPRPCARRSASTTRVQVACVDASGIAMDTIKRDIPNTPMVGALAKVTGRGRPRGRSRACSPRPSARSSARTSSTRTSRRSTRAYEEVTVGMSKWDVTKIDEWKAEEFPRGAVIPEAGNSRRLRHRRLAQRAPVPRRRRSAPSACCAGSSAPTPRSSSKDEKVTTSTTTTARAAASAPTSAPSDAIRWCPRAANCRR